MPRVDTEARESLWRRWRDVGGSLFSTLGAVGSLVRGETVPPVELEHPHVRYEHSDLQTRRVIIVGFSILGFMWLCAFLLFLYYRFAQTHTPEAEATAAPVTYPQSAVPPEPRLQVSPRRDYQGEVAYENSELSAYKWVDRRNGIVAIPIERAMELIAQRGIPPQTAPADLKLYPPQAGTRDTGFRGKIQPEPR
jgi:hypothetical protein